MSGRTPDAKPAQNISEGRTDSLPPLGPDLYRLLALQGRIRRQLVARIHQ
jgi:hypothetical protein